MQRAVALQASESHFPYPEALLNSNPGSAVCLVICFFFLCRRSPKWGQQPGLQWVAKISYNTSRNERQTQTNKCFTSSSIFVNPLCNPCCTAPATITYSHVVFSQYYNLLVFICSKWAKTVTYEDWQSLGNNRKPWDKGHRQQTHELAKQVNELNSSWATLLRKAPVV